MKIFHPLGAARSVHFLRYHGLAVENYGLRPIELTAQRAASLSALEMNAAGARKIRANRVIKVFDKAGSCEVLLDIFPLV